MIERYVFIKLRDEHATDAGRAEIVDRTRALMSLPGVRGVTVGVPGDDAARKRWDVSIVVRFDRIEDVEAYRQHPDHRAYVDELLAPRMAVIKAWNMQLV